MPSRLLIRASEDQRLARLATSSRLAQRVAYRYVAGDDLADGLRATRDLVEHGRLVSLDLVGERVADAGDADRATDHYLDTIKAVGHQHLPAGVSIKPSQLGAASDVDAARERLVRLADVASREATHVTLDMEDATTTDVTIDLVESLRAKGYESVGCAVQAYLRRTPADVARLCDMGASVRLCKGAYAEDADVALQHRAEIDAAYRQLATHLLEHGTYPRFATHDHRLMGHVRREARRLGRRSTDYEFQMLYGVRADVQQRLVDIGEQVCVYVPFGEAWFPYFMRRLAERPANVMVFLRALWS